jgi:hypothetical protein
MSKAEDIEAVLCNGKGGLEGQCLWMQVVPQSMSSNSEESRKNDMKKTKFVNEAKNKNTIQT